MEDYTYISYVSHVVTSSLVLAIILRTVAWMIKSIWMFTMIEMQHWTITQEVCTLVLGNKRWVNIK